MQVCCIKTDFLLLLSLDSRWIFFFVLQQGFSSNLFILLSCLPWLKFPFTGKETHRIGTAHPSEFAADAMLFQKRAEVSHPHWKCLATQLLPSKGMTFIKPSVKFLLYCQIPRVCTSFFDTYRKESLPREPRGKYNKKSYQNCHQLI